MMPEYAIEGDKLTGYRNAVRAARAYLGSIGADIDAASFDRMEAERGNAPPEALANGFVVDSMDALSRLCEVGQFNVVVRAGVCFAEPS